MNYLEKIYNLKNKVAIITGGNGQLGIQYTQALVQAGVKVAIFDKSQKIHPTLKKLKTTHPHTLKVYRLDITSKVQVTKALKVLESFWGTPHILINNAALDSPPGANPTENESFENYSLKSWQSVLDVNLTGTFVCCQVIGTSLARKKRGSIINISSTYGLVSPNQNIYKYRAKLGTPFVKPVSYSATKSAILNLTRYLATYWAKNNVRVNTLSPGGVFNNQDEQFLKNYTQLVPMGRMAKENELNGAILFLASDASSYMTGANLIIDGGWTAW